MALAARARRGPSLRALLTPQRRVLSTGVPPTSFEEFVRSLAPPSFVLMSGSQRAGSFNTMLLEAARVRLMTEGAAGCEVVDLAALELPIYSQDIEATGMPPAAVALKEKLTNATGFVICCPEYNGLPTPLLLNALTWATRGDGDMYAGFKGKIASLLSTSPGPMGGLRMQRIMSAMLRDMGTVLIPGHVALGGSTKIFDKTGALVDDVVHAKVEALCGQLMHFARFDANRDKNDCIVKMIKQQKLVGEYGALE